MWVVFSRFNSLAVGVTKKTLFVRKCVKRSVIERANTAAKHVVVVTAIT